LPFQISTFNK